MGFASLFVEERQVLADRPTVIEPHAGVYGQAIADRNGIADEACCRDEHAADDRRIAGDRLKRLAVDVHIPGAGRDHGRQVMLAFLELPADSPLMVGAEPRRLEVIQGRLARRPNEREATEAWRSTTEHAGQTIQPADRRQVPRARVVVARVYEPSHSRVPDRV